MFDRASLRGIIPPIATPLTTGGEIDRSGMGRLVEHVLTAGCHGLFVLGSTGEFAFLTARQRREAVEAAVDAVAGRVPVIAGISAVGTQEAVDHCRAAMASGADFVMVTPPYFGSMVVRQEWIADHVLQIVAETDARVMLYNVPPLITDIDPRTVARLAEDDHIVGMKDSAPLLHVQDVLFRTREMGFRVLCGSEYHLAATLMVGAHGGTPSPANLIPRPYVELYEATVSGDVTRALALQEQVNRFSDTLDEIPSWPSAVKGALNLMGICGPTMAAPLPSLTAAELDLVRGHLERSGLLA